MLILQRTNKVIAERVTRYIEDKIRARVGIVLGSDKGLYMVKSTFHDAAETLITCNEKDIFDILKLKS